MWIETSQDKRVLRLGLNRPEKRNALNLDLCRELVAALDTADGDPRVGAVLLCGNGKSFCAGMDLTEAETADPAALSQIHEQLFTVHERMTKPIVAAVNGAALAGGTGLVANAHIVVASEAATFGLTEIRIGLWPFLIFRGVALAIGERRAVELALTGRIVGAREALEWGLVHQVVAHPETENTAAEIAKQLSQSSPVALRSGLAYVQEIRGKSGPEAGKIGRGIREQVLQAGDFAEGLKAYHGKRAPIWPSLQE
ncbi:MAG: enoyl-CoA hydratase/isomerase family protein [Acidobacteriota bacterium]|nr:enoyl-CoA hydratase/isomerase family protein [Acidobacteriota bacterium]